MATVIETNEATVLITDNELLGRYLNKNDMAAFEELVRRHSKLVMGVCRSMLFHTHDAEDAFQATFLILSRKSSKLLHHGSIAGWLYQTAMRNCLQVRRRKGRARETEMIEEPVGTNEPWQTIADAQERDRIYQEINRLPKRYREVIVLCHLEGHTRSEAAEFLDWTEAAVKAALARGRNLLRRRLIRRGLMTSVALGMVATATSQAQSAVTEPLIVSALQHCQNISPTVSVGSSPQFVQTLSYQGVLSMNSATLIKAVSLAATVAIAVSIPLALLAAQTTVDGSGQEIIATVDVASSTREGVGNVAISESDNGFGDLVPAESTDDNAAGSAGLKTPSHAPVDAVADLATGVEGALTDFDARFSGFANIVGDEKRFSKEDSKEYWQLMLNSFEGRAKAAQLRSRMPQQSKFEVITHQSEAYEFQAKAVEARLNLKRIAFELLEKTATKTQNENEMGSRQNGVADSAIEPGVVIMVDVKTSKIAINLGTESGVYPASRLSIFRGDKFLAKAVVAESKGETSIALIEPESRIKDINPGDRALVYLNPKLAPVAREVPELEFVKFVDKACKMFKLNVGKYPSSLGDLVKCPADMSVKAWGGPYMEDSETFDRMKRILFLTSDGENYRVTYRHQDEELVQAAQVSESESTVVPPASSTVVKPGEVLLVESTVDETLNRRVVVQADHTIVLPYAGVVSVRSKTTTEISEILEARFSKYVSNPSIFVARESASMPIKK